MMRFHAPLLSLALVLSSQAAAQRSVDSGGSDVGRPLASLLLPGLGQYLQGAWLSGAAFTATAAGGVVLALGGDVGSGDLPRSGADQRAFVGQTLVTAAAGLSAYDAFHRALPSLQRAGRYDFVTAHDAPGSLLTAPFDVRMLKRWTTWINLAFTGAVTAALVRAETEPGARYLPFRAGDGAFVGSFSYNAGVGEEALFRGWLYPVLYQHLGRRFWLANGLQAGTFGALHVPQAGSYALLIAGSAFYDGWITRRNGWSVREAAFNHFWYDVAVGAASMATQKSAAIAVTVPLRF